MIEKVPIPPHEIYQMKDIEPEPQNSQTPERLGWKRRFARRLALHGTEVRTWEGRFGEAPYLWGVGVVWSSVTQLPQDIKALRHLKSLYILNVNLFEFPSWICEMTQLERLTVRGTNITHIPDELSNLKNLRRIEFGNNLPSRLDADLRGCRKLKELFLSDNVLDELPRKLPPKTYLGLAGTPFYTYSGFLFKDLPFD